MSIFGSILDILGAASDIASKIPSKNKVDSQNTIKTKEEKERDKKKEAFGLLVFLCMIALGYWLGSELGERYQLSSNQTNGLITLILFCGLIIFVLFIAVVEHIFRFYRETQRRVDTDLDNG